ncbi:MAG: sulfotransferase domain-containing protein [Actinomycetota bacterium]|nr:sulfotransferase domain-containing protein [Actinomycetota bacterium]
MCARTRYRSSVEDSARWDGFALRHSDIVISAPSKSGTTWTQMICALLVLGTSSLPAPLTTLSPWLDMLVRPADEVYRRLDAQRHRRFVKTHTPLDGLPRVDGVTYLAVGRDPRDVAVSLHHQSGNLDRARVRRLTGAPEPAAGAAPASSDERSSLLRWMTADDPPVEDLCTLRGLAWQQQVAWSRRDDPSVVFVHYADLAHDLEAEMRRLATSLDIDVPERRWSELVEAATFERMRERADELVPDERQRLMKDNRRFFRSGTSGGWREWFTPQDEAAYDRRVALLMGPDLAYWVHHGGPVPAPPS